jgi:hypothetical protein
MWKTLAGPSSPSPGEQRSPECVRPASLHRRPAYWPALSHPPPLPWLSLPGDLDRACSAKRGFSLLATAARLEPAPLAVSEDRPRACKKVNCPTFEGWHGNPSHVARHRAQARAYARLSHCGSKMGQFRPDRHAIQASGATLTLVSRISLRPVLQRYLGSLQLFDSEKAATSRSLPQIFLPALLGFCKKCAFRSAKYRSTAAFASSRVL